MEFRRLCRESSGVLLHQRLPGGFGGLTAFHGLAVEGEHLLWYVERLLGGPAERFFGQPHFLHTQRLTVRLFAALFVGAAVGDVRVADDKMRLPGGGLRGLEGGVNGIEIVSVNFLHLPAVSAEARGHIFREGDVRRTLDGDLIIIVEIDEVIQPEMPRQRCRLVRGAFHHLTIGDKGVDLMLEDGETGFIEARGKVFLRYRHAHAVGEALSQRPGGRLDAEVRLIFGMSRRLATPLPELLQVFHAERKAGEIEQSIEQHRAVPGGENEAVAVGPRGVRGIDPQIARPEHVGDIRHTHRHPRMTGIGFLHGVHRQHP